MKSLILLALLATLQAGHSADLPPIPKLGAPTTKPLSRADLNAQYHQDSNGNYLLELPQILNTATDTQAQSLLSGQIVITTGQVQLKNSQASPTRSIEIVRDQVLCCSKHLRHCIIEVLIPDQSPPLPPSSWVKITGTIEYRKNPTTGKETQVRIHATHVSPIQKPDTTILP